MIRPKTIVGALLSLMILILGSSYSSYPIINTFGAIDPFLNGALPSHTPGPEGGWQLEDSFADISIPSPISIQEWPLDESLMILSKIGQIWKVAKKGDDQSMLLDISNRTFSLSDAGILGMALHPDFGDPDYPHHQLLFVYYKTHPNPSAWDERGFSRLSKFSWDASSGTFDPDSEEILIQQYDRSPWHNGGPMLFGDDGFLYFSVGDEGDTDFQPASTQRLDGGFFSGLFRIDVDNDPDRSHPIRRQPLSNDTPPSGWGDTYSQGYSIPNDNPWQDESGALLEEYYALGLRSPFAMQYDDQTGEIWIVDAGSDQREELNIIRKGDNLQWPYLEGTLPSPIRSQPDDIIGVERAPFFEYDRSIGTCMVGGALYRHDQFPDLYNHFVFGDFTSNKIATLYKDDLDIAPQFQTLISDITAFGIDLPHKPGITGVFQTNEGRILITIIGEDHAAPGRIVELKSQDVVPDPAEKLSQLNVFEDLQDLRPIAGVLPYSVNAPLWSDGAIKQRWVAIPNDGDFDQPSEQISFDPMDAWTFPIGTVFIKHFALPDPDGFAAAKPIETRFFVITEDDRPYGLTYKWDADGQDATLQKISTSADLFIHPDEPIQRWTFPSRSQCISCHNQNAGSVLGFKTTQLNKDFNYDFGVKNQIDYFNEINLFQRPISHSSNYPSLNDINNTDVALESRIRSYLDANCANCHREGGVPTLDMDFRYAQTKDMSNYFDRATKSHASPAGSKLIVPGSHVDSEVWVRDASTSEHRMPPIGRSLVDQAYVDSLAVWIDNIEPDSYQYHDILIYPNPAADWIAIHAQNDWAPPYEYSIYSIDGRRMRYIKSDNPIQTIDVGGYPRGTYVISVQSEDDRNVSKVVLR